MRSSQLTASLAIASLCSFAQAWPLFILSARSPMPQSYSVVAVGGSSTANNAPAPTRTITNAITQTQIQTSISTVTVDGSASPTTIIATVPHTITAEVTVAETATMVVAPSVESSAYDNGLWHTTYYKASTLSDVFVPVETILPTAVSSQRVDVSTAAASTITAAPSVSSSTPINWATAYGTARTSAVNGSWWGKDKQ